MKKILVLIVSVLLVLSCFTACSDNGSKNPEKGNKGTANTPSADQAAIVEDTPENPIIMRVSDADVSVGDVFTITVSIENEEWTWSSFEFVFNYDPDVIKINDIRPTEFTDKMVSLGNTDYTESSSKIAYATGSIMNGGGDLVEIECTAIAEGSFDIVLTEEMMYRCVTIAATGEIATRLIDLEVETGSIIVRK